MGKVKIFWIPGVAFLLLFPGFFFYHALLGLGYISPILGGYFGYISLVLYPLLLLTFFRQIHRQTIRLSKIDYLFILLMIYIIFVATSNFAASGQDSIDLEMLEWSLSGVSINGLMYMIARTIDLNSAWMRWLCILSLGVMCALVFSNIGRSGIFYLSQDAAIPEVVASYQGFGRSLVLSALFILSGMDKKLGFIIIAFIAGTALFFNGARSEFLGFLLAASVTSFLIFNLGRSFIIVISIFCILLLVSNYIPSDLIESNRMFELLNIDNSSSALARKELMSDALVSISEHPFLGSYGSYARSLSIGAYAHNLLSAWVNLGILGFAWYVGIFAFYGLLLISKLRSRESIENSYIYGTCFYCFSLFLMLFAKNYNDMTFGLMAGFIGRIDRK